MEISRAKKSFELEVKKDEIQFVKPFIRWAGGKQNLIKILSEHLPKSKINSYHEPFVGAGALFFANEFNSSFLSDINPHLINSYNCIKESVEELHIRIMHHKKNNSKEYYYKVRERFNKLKNSFNIEQGANFIYLVHSSFNGIYRVNKKGEYNVPFGKPNPAIPKLDHLYLIQKKLRNVVIANCIYEDALNKVAHSDFVYFDPPYPPLSDTAFFQHYSIDKFPENQQIQLSEYAQELSDIGAYVMISNAETPLIKKIYKSWNIKKVKTYRYVNCKSERKAVNELIITNY